MILLKKEKATQRKSRENDEDDKENMQQFLQNEEVSICTVRFYKNTYMMGRDLQRKLSILLLLFSFVLVNIILFAQLVTIKMLLQ